MAGSELRLSGMLIIYSSLIFIGILYQAHGKVDKKCVCGVSNGEINRRIVGGEVASPYEFPWVVALFNRGELHCGGSIISNRHVLTAGHCISFGVVPTDITVHVGMHDLDASDNLRIPVVSGVKHPQFTSNPVRDENDIAILSLASKVVFGERIRPICLPEQRKANENLDFYINKSLVVAGWGRVESSKSSSRYLLHTKVKIINYRQCKAHAVYDANLVADSMMCAYAVGKDACQGDSGGALFFETEPRRYLQVGIVSWGIDCAKKDFPGVYTIVPNYVKWIKEVTRDGTFCRE